MRSVKLLTCLLWLLSAVLQSHAFSWPHWGRCPDLPVKQDFQLASYTGRWYEQAGYNTEEVEGDKRCVYAFYSLDSNGVFYVRNAGIDNSNNQLVLINGTAKFEDVNKKDAKLIVSFKFGWWTVDGPYWVLDTDYETYSVVYTCQNTFLFFHYYTVWFLSREQTFSSYTNEQAFYGNAYTVIQRVGIPDSYIRTSLQQHCY